MRSKTYPSDLSDDEWTVIAPLLPPAQERAPHGGRPAHERREIIDAIRYLVRTGCSWRQLPIDFPPWQSVYTYFAAQTADDTLDRIHDTLRAQTRALKDREATPTAVIIDA